MTSPCRLYLLTPPRIEDLDGFASCLEDALSGGDVAALQVRLKSASEAELETVVRRLMPIAHRRDVALILNDRPDLAAQWGCDGVHVGQEDASCLDARRALGPGRMVGVTCHDSRHLAMEASESGADYVAFGAFFDTATKVPKTRADLELLSIWQESMTTPCVAIGGVTVATAAELAAAGADFVAVSAGVWSFEAGPKAAVAAFETELQRGAAARL